MQHIICCILLNPQFSFEAKFINPYLPFKVCPLHCFVLILVKYELVLANGVDPDQTPLGIQ